jgi:hypothetical protein
MELSELINELKKVFNKYGNIQDIHFDDNYVSEVRSLEVVEYHIPDNEKCKFFVLLRNKE